MAFQINLSPLERSSRGIGQGLGNIGNMISDSMRRNQAQEYKNQARGDIEAYMSQALTGDPVALKELMVRDPQRAQYVAQQLQQGIDKEQGEVDRFQGERALATADIVEKIAFAKSPEEATMIFNAGVDDPKFDLDENDRNIYTNRGKQKALIAEVKGQEYADNLFGEKTKFSQGTGKMSGYVFNPDIGEYSIKPEVKEILDNAVDEKSLSIKDKITLNKEFTTLTKDTKGIHAAAASLATLRKTATATDKLAAIFKFMKSLDPTSVVREGEQQMAVRTGGATDVMVGYINSIKGEGSLSETSFTNMVNTAKNLANSAINSSTPEIEKYLATFGDDLSPNFKKAMMNRMPPAFGMKDQVEDKDKNTTVIMTHPIKGDITEAMIQSTMTANGMTREQVITKLGEK